MHKIANTVRAMSLPFEIMETNVTKNTKNINVIADFLTMFCSFSVIKLYWVQFASFSHLQFLCVYIQFISHLSQLQLSDNLHLKALKRFKIITLPNYNGVLV